MRAGYAQAADPDDRLVDRIEATLADYLGRRRADAAQVHPSFAEAADVLTRFVLDGGKRIRPTFAWWGWRGAGGDPGSTGAGGDPDNTVAGGDPGSTGAGGDPGSTGAGGDPGSTGAGGDPAVAVSGTEVVLRVAGALELVQACALVHDDLMDHSDTRRGNPTVHVEFAARHARLGWAGPPEDFGSAAAILLGDLALAWADDMVNDSGMTADQRSRVRPVWAAMRTEVLGGQFLDSRSQASGDESLEAAMRVNRFKTAAYTVERPLQLGAALAGAPAELVEAYRGFGADVGVAFQLRDDMLGVFGDPEVTGKPAGDDLREGKRTLLVALAFDAARRAGRTAEIDVLDRALGDPDLDASTLARAREVLHELGAVAEVERRIERLTRSGLATLAAARVAPPADTALVELAHAATRRRY